MSKLTGAQALVQALRVEGVETAFGIPGHQNLDIYDALAQQDQIRHVLARHEEGAGYMADGYARVSGRPGVAITTTGPGGCNIMAALGEAYADSSPILHIMSAIDLEFIGKARGIDHEMKDQMQAFQSVTAWNALVRRPAASGSAPDSLRRAGARRGGEPAAADKLPPAGRRWAPGRPRCRAASVGVAPAHLCRRRRQSIAGHQAVARLG